MAHDSWRTDNEARNLQVKRTERFGALFRVTKLAKASEQFRQSDVTLWGIMALACIGLAVFSSNASLLVPQSIIAGLHQPRTSGATIETLRREVSALRTDTTRLQRENEQLLSRFAMQEKSGNDIVRRVGALEVTVPNMLEIPPYLASIDQASTTASIGANESPTFETEGGSVSVRQSALPQPLPYQPLPAPVVQQTDMAAPNQNAYGVSIGTAVPFDQAPGLWSDLTLKLGPLLFGMSPLLVDEANSDNKRIIVGPIEELSEARQLCERFERISIACMPMPYDGTPLAIELQGG